MLYQTIIELGIQSRENLLIIYLKLQQVAYLAEAGLFDEKYLLENYAGVFYKS